MVLWIPIDGIHGQNSGDLHITDNLSALGGYISAGYPVLYVQTYEVWVKICYASRAGIPIRKASKFESVNFCQHVEDLQRGRVVVDSQQPKRCFASHC